ncbi:CDP-diacylglycerol--serine O-phosphatidyltransferase [Terriglobus saanensis]|uniref:CDP-diacylglycerol--serine O-phosphatidyltransferase n=1 Tax=Terriglobus saanensis (strain ATCC BAA-1853 / DSM 23119 / SP1PR4) TaxID=401053 RepID=E8V7T0_TERSS|nr:CDP-diacylglycerol/serine O-phosphatidyltransferase [Terriglobus saanensis SP1PR4]
MANVVSTKPRPRRGMYVLPSLFTAGNIAAGFYAITQSLQGTASDYGYFDRAAIAIALAVPFDALDGRIARLTNTESDFGKELDSLADVITFGVAPAVLAYVWGFRMLPMAGNLVFRQKMIEIGVFVCFLFLICGACRLARFNVMVNPQPQNPGRPGRKYFVGMPIPAAAGVVVSVVHCFNGAPIDNPWISLVWLGLVLFAGFLMVSRWRFWSAKEIRVESRQPMRMLIVLVVLCVLLVKWSEYVLIIVALAYMVSGLWARLMYASQAKALRARRVVDNSAN